MAADKKMLEEVEENIQGLADEAFKSLDGDYLTYNSYVTGKERFMNMLRISVLSILQYYGVGATAMELRLPESISRELIEGGNDIALAYLRASNYEFITKDPFSTDDSYDYSKTAAEHVFYGNVYMEHVASRWKEPYDFNDRLKFYFSWIEYAIDDYVQCGRFRMCGYALEHEIEELQKELASEVSKDRLEKLVKVAIEKLKEYPNGTCPEDYELADFWEEICFQVQTEFSIDWNMYIDLIHITTDGIIDSLNREQILEIWLYGRYKADFDETDFAECYDEDNYIAIKETVHNALFKVVMEEAGIYESDSLSRALEMY